MQTVNINVIPLKAPLKYCFVSQNDVGRQIRFNLWENLTPYTLGQDDVTTLHIEKPDGSILSKPLTKGDDYVILDVDSDITNISGRLYAKINIENDNQSIGTSAFYIIVKKQP